METDQRQALQQQIAVAKKNAGQCRRDIDEDPAMNKRCPARYQRLEWWLFANMTPEQLEYTRNDYRVPEDLMTNDEAVKLLDHFFDEVREAFASDGALEEFDQKDDESFEQHARRLVEYAFHDDMGDVSVFLADYQSKGQA